MDHRTIIDAALRGLPAERAVYLRKVVDCLQRRADLEDRRHLLYPVLAAAAPTLEPMLEPDRLATIAAAFARVHGEGLAATIYGPRYLADGQAVLRPWAARFLAVVAAEIMDRMASGEVSVTEPTIWRFRSDGPPSDFPYDDSDE